MARQYCNADGCTVHVIGPVASVAIGYGTAAGILAKPFFNALGADIKNVSSIVSINAISLTSVVLFLAIVICGYICTHDRHTHPLLCFINACGLPGVILALMTAVT